MGEELGRLSARVIFLRAMIQHSGELPVTVDRLERLAQSVHRAVQDTRAAARAWENAR